MSLESVMNDHKIQVKSESCLLGHKARCFDTRTLPNHRLLTGK